MQSAALNEEKYEESDCSIVIFWGKESYTKLHTYTYIGKMNFKFVLVVVRRCVCEYNKYGLCCAGVCTYMASNATDLD